VTQNNLETLKPNLKYSYIVELLRQAENANCSLLKSGLNPEDDKAALESQCNVQEAIELLCKLEN